MAGSVLKAADRKRVFAEQNYWDEEVRYVFAEPEKIREPRSVPLEIPQIKPPSIVMPLPEPGPLLRYSGYFKRLDGSEAPEKRIPDGNPEPPVETGEGEEQ